MVYKAWVAKVAKQPMAFTTVEPGPLGTEEVEVAVEHCGLCHSDLSIFNDEFGISQFPATLGHEVVGRVTAVGSSAKGVAIGQQVGVGWFSGSCMHCRQCLSGRQHLCPQAQLTIVGPGAASPPTSAATGPGPFRCPTASISPTPRRCSAAASPCSRRLSRTPSPWIASASSASAASGTWP